MADAPSPRDSWALDDGKYSPRNFYTTSTDGHGHSEVLYVKISPYMHGVLSSMIQQRLIPEYSTIGALIRDSVAHRLHQISEEFGDMRVTYAENQILMYEKQLARAERRQREEKLTAQFVENLQRASTDEEREEVMAEAQMAIVTGMIMSAANIATLQPFLPSRPALKVIR